MHSEKLSTTTATGEGRKSSKPIMEKRRRARMNASLTELKALLLEVMKKEGARHSKMEKADILELTVKHLRQLQRQHFSVGANDDPTILNKYRLGFSECATEVSRYLTSIDEVDIEVRARLLNHLACYMTNYGSSSTSTSPISTHSSMSESSYPSPELSTISPRTSQTSQISVPITQPVISPVPPVESKPTAFTNEACTTTTTTTNTTTPTTTTCSIANGGLSFATNPQLQTAKFLSSVQLIPTKLPNGEVAFVLPTNLMTGTQPQQPSYIIPIYASTSQTITPLTTAVTSTPSVMALLPQVTGNGLKTCAVAPMQNTATIPHILSNTNQQVTALLSPISDYQQINCEPCSSLIIPTELSPSISTIVVADVKKSTSPLPNEQPTFGQSNIVIPEPSVIQNCAEENVWRPWAH